MKVYFVGAGPGDPELITLKGSKILGKADIVIWAGSLVNPGVLDYCPTGIPVYNSAEMDFNQVSSIYREQKNKEGTIARIHTGDPSIYGAIQEQIDFCRMEDIPFEVVPGVSSFQAAAAAMGQELTLPGVTQTIILSRAGGRTPVPGKESIKKLAESRSSLILFLSISQIEKISRELSEIYGPETPCSVVYRVGWEDQTIIRGTLEKIASLVLNAGITRQALIFVGEVLKTADEPGFYEMSKLYAPGFSHGYRNNESREIAEAPDERDNKTPGNRK